ncbi:zeaxanthin epoxidase [Klebsormidium nitens]|uniref:Zeaxanthin epoxidase n=1 Tax=Klebsormidium nitens TaxID=105231 RepID=A0A1Y1HK25_KLENI|nr:zeaxanthin epoxidase [Klebsormidium nitens]|eukprot:GAQ78915.1 zeaxanthin epoxidase [Klebsormidium nitens]
MGPPSQPGSEARSVSDPAFMNVDVAIAGAGLGGLALALGLKERGITAHVFEAAPAPRTDGGTVIGFFPNGQTALNGVSPGLTDRIKARGNRCPSLTSIRLCDGVLEEELKRDNQSGIAMVPWKDFQEILASSIPPEQIHCNHRLQKFTPVEGGVEAVFDIIGDSDARENYSASSNAYGGAAIGQLTVRTKLLVGADGIRSNVRKAMGGKPPQYLGDLHWNLLVHDPDETMVPIKDESHMRFADEKAGIVGFLSDAGHKWRFLSVRKADPDGKIVAGYGPEFGGLGKPGVKERAIGALPGSDNWYDVVRETLRNVAESDIFERRIMDNVALDTWVAADGHVVLIGDAAHAMHPIVGQGAMQTFEDAHQLAELLKKEAGPDFSTDGVATAVHRFEKVKKRRAELVQAFSREASSLPKEVTVPAEYQDLSGPEKLQRFSQLNTWMQRYPDVLGGDPDSVYWKPLES